MKKETKKCEYCKLPRAIYRKKWQKFLCGECNEQMITTKQTKKEMYKCQSYYDDENVLCDCSCGKCGETKKEYIEEVKDIKNKFACDLDHIKPLSKGGKHTDNNVQFLCKKCNAYKSNKII